MGVAWFLVVTALAGKAAGQAVEADACAVHTDSCGDCIRDPSVCIWCASYEFSGAKCKSAKTVTDDWCPGSIINPVNSISVDDNLDFNSNIGYVTQIRPQRIRIDLRPGIPSDFSFSFKPASAYPVDLYFLLDASSTMSGIKNKIQEQSKNIYDTMVKLTTNILLGMGSFVDKNAIPFTDKLDSENTYSFRNRLKLTNDSEKFKKTVTSTPFAYNFDDPEGGLDALAQVITCKDRIGWRNESRKLIVLLTDGPYHQAGDGSAAGIFQPYDGKCYLNDKGVYTKELEMDYPSLGIIRKLAADEEITIIFVVKPAVEFTYSRLSESLGAKYLTYTDGSRISSYLTDIYEDITRKIKLKVNIKPEFRNNFLVTFQPDCTIHSNNSLNCNVRKDEDKSFTGTITLLKYFEMKDMTIDIVVEGIKEKLQLVLNVIKDCNCPNNKPKAPECSEAGTLSCGICKCDENRYGDKCACATNSKSGSSVNDTSNCIAEGGDELCSGHGSCICGSCICRSDAPYSGKYCQFNKDNCPRHNNEVCNGHGSCVEEKCVCADEWTGDACQCPKLNKQCIGPNRKLCNNRGECQCGKCACLRTAKWDARENQDPHCNILPCPDCHKPQCDILQSCARCALSRESCALCNNDVNFTRVELLHSLSGPSWKVCPDLRIEVGCYTRYMYRYRDSIYGIEMAVQTDKNCLESYYMYGGICLGSIILIGIATLVGWKWMTDAQDRREYERFLQEHAEDISEPCVNVCYKPASTTVYNPSFRKPSVDFNL